MIIAGTGHRPPKIGGFKIPNPTYIKICQAVETHLKELKPEKVISGFALGYDQYLAHVANQLNIPVIAAVPFKGQELKWTEQSQKLYNSLIKKASEIVIVSEGEYSALKMQIRNEWMVNKADKILALWDGTDGGTANAVQYAKSINKEIIRINPKEL